MNLTIIIPNYNSSIIDKTIASIINQTTKHSFEIIVVGVDKFGLVCEKENISFFNTVTRCPPSKARNIGANLSKGEILVFIDSDCIAPAFWLEKLLEPFLNEDIIAVGGGVKFPENNYWTLADNISMFYEFMVTNSKKFVTKLPSLNLAVRKKTFLGAHGFDEKFLFPSGEDFDFTFRLSQKGKLLFYPNAWIFHHPPRASLKSLVKHSYFQGKYSTKLSNSNNFYSFIIYHPVILFLIAPLLSILVTLKILLKNKNIKYFYLFPAILISKFTWCIGAISSPLRESKKNGKKFI